MTTPSDKEREAFFKPWDRRQLADAIVATRNSSTYQGPGAHPVCLADIYWEMIVTALRATAPLPECGTRFVGASNHGEFIKIDDGQSTHARTAKEWLDLARADLASRSTSGSSAESLATALRDVLDTGEAEAKATLTAINADNNFSDSSLEDRAQERAMLAASAAEKRAREVLDAFVSARQPLEAPWPFPTGIESNKWPKR